jgi:hypothetical protein
MSDYRILVTGSRDWDDADAITFALDAASLDALGRNVIVVHGACPRGADFIAEQAARYFGFETEPHPAAWDAPCRPECRPGHRRRKGRGPEYCPAAGNYRNQEMVDAGATVALAFFQPGAANTGTSDCVRRAIAAGIPVTPYGEVPRTIREQILRAAGSPS